jgi:uncharacterized protein (TIGR02271 family)
MASRSTQKRSTIVGVFEDRTQADRAISELKKAGFRDDQIGVVTRRDQELGTATTTGEAGDETHADSGALAGALAGAGLGALAGLGILAGVIPVIGPAIAGGTLGVILSNAAAGAGIAGLAGALIGAGVPEEEASYYESELGAGRTIVTVQANGRSEEATAILRRYGAYDMNTRRAASTTSTSAGAAAAATGTATASRSTGRAQATGAQGGQTIEVREEELQARTRPVDAGEVRVRKDVVTEHKSIDVPVQREEVVIEHHAPSGRHAASGDIRAGEEVRIPVKEEEVVVDKRAVVKDEVTVGKRVVQDTERVSGEVRKEQVHVERKGDVDVCSTDPGSTKKGTGGTKDRK